MAPNRPLLANYPHLRQLLSTSPLANLEFNAAIGKMRTEAGLGDFAKELQDKLEISETNLQEFIQKYEVMMKLTEATVRFIRLLGETIETQTAITPYTEDLAKLKEYSIQFTATQIRLALHLHWDIVGAAMESEISRSLMTDPAAERSGS